MKKLICIPTYNESGNIANIITAINELELDFNIVVIDDGSPDGTAKIVKKLMGTCDNVTLIERTGKLGLASAYLKAFKHGLDNNYDFIGEMDADFSHAPEALREINRHIESGAYDFIIGSRYVKGGETVNWGPLRKLISRGGSLYARTILRLPIRDVTGGFNFWSNRCLRTIDIKSIVSEGYVFQIELKARAYKAGMKFIESPITFEDRRVGESKMSKRIVLEAIYKVVWLKWILSRC